jgi:hypothetical protein
MTVNLRHLRVSTVGDNLDPNQLQGPDWNAAHTIQQGPSSLLGRADATAGQANTAEILLDASLAFLAGKLAVATGVFLPLAGGTLTGPLTGTTASFTGNIYASAVQAVAATAPDFWWDAAGNATDLKFWDFALRTDGKLYLRALNDAITVEQQLFIFGRDGVFTAPYLIANNTGTFGGQVTSPQLVIRNTTDTSLFFDDTSNPANQRKWRVYEDSSGTLIFQPNDDAYATQGYQWNFNRNGTTELYAFNKGGNGPSLGVTSFDDGSYAPANISLWRANGSTGTAPSNSAVGQIRFHGINNAGYTEWGGIHVDLQGLNDATHRSPAGMGFWIDIGNSTAQSFMLLDGLNQRVSVYKDLQIGGISGNGFYFGQTAAGSVYPNLGVVGADTQINFVLYGKGGGSVYLNTNGPAAGTCAVATTVDFTPGGDNTKGLGRSGLQWSNVYSVLGTFSGTITSTKGSGAIVSATGLGTNGAYNLFSSTGNTAAFGIEGSVAGATWAGTAAYATLMGGTAAEIDFATVNVVRFSIATGGVTSTVPITMPTPAATTADTTVATTAFVKTAGATATSKVPAKFGSSTAFTSIGTYVSNANTGSIGASGQVWLVFARVGVDQTVAAQHYHTVQIWNGTAAVDTQSIGVFTANTVVWTNMFAIVTLTAATTFTIRGTTDATSVGSINGDSMIGAVRLG